MYVLMCSSLGLSCLGLSVFPGLGWLFPFPCLGSFQLLSLQIFFSGPFCLSSPSGTPFMGMLVHLLLSQRPLRLSSFLFILCFYILFCSSYFHHSVLQVSYPFFCFCYSVVDSFQSVVHLWLVLFFVLLLFSYSMSLLNISCIFSILFRRSWIILIIIILISFFGSVYHHFI